MVMSMVSLLIMVEVRQMKFMRIIVNVLLRTRKIQLRMMVSTRITPMMPPHYTDRFLISAILYMHIREKQEGLKLFPDIALHL